MIVYLLFIQSLSGVKKWVTANFDESFAAPLCVSGSFFNPTAFLHKGKKRKKKKATNKQTKKKTKTLLTFTALLVSTDDQKRFPTHSRAFHLLLSGI